MADCLKDLDFVALNEVHGPRLWERDDQAALLGRRLGVQWLFAPATRDWHTIDFGNGLLTSLPVESWQRIPLDGQQRPRLSQRGARALAAARADDQRALDPYRPQRRPHPAQQLHQTIDLYLALPVPAIFLGDLNSEAAEPEIRRLLAAPGVIDAVGQKLGPDAPPRIDLIFVRGLRVLGCRPARSWGFRSSPGLGRSDDAVNRHQFLARQT